MSLRAVRDFLQTKDKSLVDRYYQHAFEVAAILRNSPHLRRDFQELTLGNLCVAQGLVASGQATIDRQSLQAILAFLEKLQGRASQGLKKTLEDVVGKIGQEGFLRKIGIQVIE